MSTRATDIFTAIKTALRTPRMTSVPAGRVYSNMMVALERKELPAVVVELGDEDPTEIICLGSGTCNTVERVLTIMVRVLVDADDPYAAADDAWTEAHGRIMADRRLVTGGTALCETIKEGATDRRRHDSGIGIISKTYAVTYRTAHNALT